jgi:DNA helicase II / ATP-dependent DNA helicase PcrA
MFRASHHSASLEVELTRHNIPFVKFGGLKFLEVHGVDEKGNVILRRQLKRRYVGFPVGARLLGLDRSRPQATRAAARVGSNRYLRSYLAP